eukprot:2757799-Amphidinium_carterae.1
MMQKDYSVASIELNSTCIRGTAFVHFAKALYHAAVGTQMMFQCLLTVVLPLEVVESGVPGHCDSIALDKIATGHLQWHLPFIVDTYHEH